MAEFSNYPNQIDTTTELPKATDNVTPVKAEIFNRLREAIINVEVELGIQPSSTFSTVKDRLDSLQSLINAIIDIQTNGIDLSTLVPKTRNIIAGAGLIGGGSLSDDITINVGSNADGSITINDNDIKIGILATDDQHGSRSGGSLHSNVIASGAAGFMTGSDKSKLDGIETGAQLTNFSRVSTALAAASSGVTFNSQNLSSIGSLGLVGGIVFTTGGSFSITQTANASTNGLAAVIKAQDGANGFDGGAITVSGGIAPDTSFNHYGQVNMELGNPSDSDSNSAKLSLKAGFALEFGYLRYENASCVLVGTNGLTLAYNSASSTRLKFASGSIQLSSGQWYENWFAITFNATLPINWNNGNKQRVTLTNNITSLSITNAQPGATYFLEFTQDATGNRTITFPTSFKFNGATAATDKTLSTTGNAVDLYQFICSGTLGTPTFKCVGFSKNLS